MKIKNNSQVEIAYTEIRNQIIFYKLLPETLISDNKLAQTLKMSRAPVREAIIHLQMDGLIQTNEDGKLIVAPIRLEDIQDILHVRRALESEAIQLIAAKGWLTKEQTKDLTQTHQQLENCDGFENVSKFYYYDDLFHSKLVEYSQSPRIIDTLERMRLQMQRARWLNATVPSRQEEAFQEHALILEAVIEQDSQKAVASINQHFTNSNNVFTSILSNEQMRILASAISNFYSVESPQ